MSLRERSGHGHVRLGAGLQRHHVVDVGKRHQAFEVMIAVGAATQH